MTMSARPRNPAAMLRALRDDRRGLALLEFALTLPIIILIGGYGVELSNLALTNLRVSQFALNLADNASRVGVDLGAGVTQLREADVNDVLAGTLLEGKPIGLGDKGRVILSSLEKVRQPYDTVDGIERIHWQRCFGRMGGADFNSHYGTTTTTAGTTPTAANAGTVVIGGMGDTNAKVTAPAANGVMFVEINYRYDPLFGGMFMSPTVIRYTASLLVRDNRDYSQLHNPNPVATRSTCNIYAG